MKNLGYISEIDGLRAIAVLSVFLYHLDLGILPGGFTGVDVFFVISGYVVTLAAARYAGESSFFIFSRDFYRRRMARILPPLILMLVVISALSVMFVPQAWITRLEAETAISAIFGLSNFVLYLNDDSYFAPATEFNVFTNTWSLAVEEQFYFLFPALFLIWWRGTRSGTGATWRKWTLPLLCSGSFIYCIWASTFDPRAAFYMIPARFWELGLGVLIAQWAMTGAPLPSPVVRGWVRSGVPLGLVLIATGFIVADAVWFPFPWALLPVLGTSAVLLGLSITPDQAARPPLAAVRFLRWRPLRGIGLISYALYLWHWPVIVLVRWTIGLETPVGLALAVVVPFVMAAVSYHLLETPLRRWMVTPIKSFGLATVMVGIASFAVFQLYSNRVELTLSVTSDRSVWGVEGRRVKGSLEGPFRQHTIWVIGDSHADAYTPLLAMVSRNLGFSYRINQARCGIGLIVQPVSGPECEERQARLISDFVDFAIPGDVLFFASLRVPRFTDQGSERTFEEIMQDARSFPPTSVSLSGMDQFSALLSELEAAGIVVLVDLPKPIFRALPFRCSDWFNASNPVCAPGFEITVDEMEHVRSEVVTAMMTLAARHANLVVWDPLPLLCETTVCNAIDPDGTPRFFDADHLSAYGNGLLADNFRRVLIEIWDGVQPDP